MSAPEAKFWLLGSSLLDPGQKHIARSGKLILARWIIRDGGKGIRDRRFVNWECRGRRRSFRPRRPIRL